MTDEHIFPDWMTGGRETWRYIMARVGKAVRGATVISDVCAPCNNGPLSDLDSAARESLAHTMEQDDGDNMRGLDLFLGQIPPSTTNNEERKLLSGQATFTAKGIIRIGYVEGLAPPGALLRTFSIGAVLLAVIVWDSAVPRYLRRETCELLSKGMELQAIPLRKGIIEIQLRPCKYTARDVIAGGLYTAVQRGRTRRGAARGSGCAMYFI